MQKAVFGRNRLVALRLVNPVAFYVKLGVHRRITHTHFGTALISQRQFVLRRGLFVRQVNLCGMVVNRLFAEEFVFFFFAFAEFGFAQDFVWIGRCNDFGLVHIVAVSDLELNADALIGYIDLRHKGLLWRQQIIGIYCECEAAQA